MTILVAYAPRPEGWAALEKGIKIAKERNEQLLIVNAGPGGMQEDASLAQGYEVDRVEAYLAAENTEAVFKQFVRGKSALDEINDLVDEGDISMLVIGLRRRSAVGKLIMGSVAQDLLMTVSCPVLCVKAPGA